MGTSKTNPKMGRSGGVAAASHVITRSSLRSGARASAANQGTIVARATTQAAVQAATVRSITSRA